MRRIISVSFLLSALVLISISSAQQPASTAVPNLIRYGGVLKDAQGAAISSMTAGVTFAIYKQQDGSAPIWMETQNVAPDASGQYSVVLGSTTAIGLPSDLFSQQEQRWLGVQVQGEAEQARVLLVSVPYAFKAHEAETLGGRTVSDFVLANGANSAANAPSNSQSPTLTASSNPASNGVRKGAASAGPTNFSGSTTDQIVQVTQTGSGAGISASTSNTSSSSNAVEGRISGPGVAIYGSASSTSAQAYGVQGNSASTIGIGLLGFATSTTGSTYGLKGYSSSTGGTGVRGLSTATTGSTTGISASVASAAGTAGVFNNVAGGKILIGQNNGVEKFAVDGSGDVNAAGTFTGSGSGLTGIPFSNLSGTLANSQFSGGYSNAVNLSNSSNVYYGNGSNLTGVVAGAVFVNTNYPIVNLPTQAGQQVALGALRLPAGAFNMLNGSFDIWAAITWVGFVGGIFQPGLYLCDTSTCSGQLNAVLGYGPEAHGPNPEPSGINVRASYAMSAAGTSASAVGSEAVQVDNSSGSSSPIYSSSNQQSQQFDSTQSLYFVVMIYMDSLGTQFVTPTAQMNALRLSIAY